MNSKQFQIMLDTYGADLSAWPERQLAKAHSFITVSVEARKALEVAAQVENALQESWQFPGDAVAAGQRLTRQALRQIDTIERQFVPTATPFFQFSWLETSALATASMIIFIFGAMLGTPAGNSETGAVQTLIIDGPYRSYAAL